MIEIIKKYPQQYKVKCSICGLEKNINKRYFERKGFDCPSCLKKLEPLQATPSHFVEEIIIEPLQATPEENRVDQRHVETEKIIIKKSKKHK